MLVELSGQGLTAPVGGVEGLFSAELGVWCHENYRRAIRRRSFWLMQSPLSGGRCYLALISDTSSWTAIVFPDRPSCRPLYFRQLIARRTLL